MLKYVRNRRCSILYTLLNEQIPKFETIHLKLTSLDIKFQRESIKLLRGFYVSDLKDSLNRIFYSIRMNLKCEK